MPGKATREQKEKKEETKKEDKPKTEGKKEKKTQRKLKPRKEILKLPIYERKSRNFGIGNSVQPRRNLTRFVKWPAYVRLQRQKKNSLL